MTRPLTVFERKIVSKMLEADFLDRKKLERQISASHVKLVDELGSLEFVKPNGPKVENPDGPIVSALQMDYDTVENYGPYINYVLFVKGGLVSELQVYKDDGSSIGAGLDPEKIISIFPGKKGRK